MQKRAKRLFFVFAFSLTGMGYAVTASDIFVKPTQALSCCNFGADCNPGSEGGFSAELACCYPRPNEAPCQEWGANYCRTTCS
jgi:hypothetical protein